MSRQRFVETRERDWDELAAALRLPRGAAGARVPALYRAVCRDLALARHRRYGHALVVRLNSLAVAGHAALYGRRTGLAGQLLEFFALAFPARVRSEPGPLLLALLLLFGGGAATALAVALQPDLIHAIVDAEQLAELEHNVDDERTGGWHGRAADSDFEMFGFYVLNNIGIAFRVFAGGILFGLGTLFFLSFNGVVLGGITAHIHHIGSGRTFDAFVIGHGAFELTGIALAGQAGLLLARAWFAPGRRTRGEALRSEGRNAFPIIAGAACMLAIAAAIEAFWSSSGASHETRLAVGGVLWMLVLAWLGFGGRGARALPAAAR